MNWIALAVAVGGEGGGGATTMVAATPVATCAGDVASTPTPRLEDTAAGGCDVSELAASKTDEAVAALPLLDGAVSGMVMITLMLTLPAATRSSR